MIPATDINNSVFRDYRYAHLNARRLEHLTSLGLDLHNRTVLETGAGIGDLTAYFLDRGCQVTATDARRENIDFIRQSFMNVGNQLKVGLLDLDSVPDTSQAVVGAHKFNLVFCYGVLYHLMRPAGAIAYMAEKCEDLLLLETVVSTNPGSVLTLVEESSTMVNNSMQGTGCRPTRLWIMDQLKQHFDYVYTTATQPWHEEFQIEWDSEETTTDKILLGRAVFAASRRPIVNELLVENLPNRQWRH